MSEFSIQCLGVPVFAGRCKIVYFEHLIDKVRRKLEWWKAKTLSSAGRLKLLKSVLASMPIYTLASSNVRITIIRRIVQLMCNFSWHARGEKHVHWVGRESVCNPKVEGGLGVRRLAHFQYGLHRKLLWLAFECDTLWGRFARAKYVRKPFCCKKFELPFVEFDCELRRHLTQLRAVGRSSR